MYHLMVSTDSNSCERVDDLSALPALTQRKERVFWLDFEQPTAQEIEQMQAIMHFHPLAIEDAVHHSQRPKIDSYETYYFFIFYSLGWGRYAHEPEAGLRMRQIGVFVGPNYLITIHHKHVPEILETMKRWETNREIIGDTVGAVAYAMLDALVDSYFPVIDEISDRAETLEEQIFEHYRDNVISEIFGLKKDLLNLRRVISPSRDVLNIMMRRQMPIFDKETIVYLTDVYDHVVRVTDSIDTYRDLLSSALDGYLSMASNRMNTTMRVLTSSSIILMSMALVAGIYGMNFRYMPELEWPFGYGFAILLMLGIGLVLYFFFKRRGWL